MWSRVMFPLVMLLWVLPALADAQSFGRLFTTPAERVALDRARVALLEELALDELLNAEELPAIEEPPVQEMAIVQLGGIVRRADGRHTVWLNGVPIDEAELPAHLNVVTESGTAALAIRTSEGAFTLKPGQTLNATAGEIRESYEVTPEQVAAINAEVAARAERLRLAAQQRADRRSANGDVDDTELEQTEQERMVQSVVEGLRVLQQLQELQDTPP